MPLTNIETKNGQPHAPSEHDKSAIDPVKKYRGNIYQSNKKIAQLEASIANLEHELAEERDRLNIYKQNQHECQNAEDLTSIVERDRRVEHWLEQIHTKYRNYHSAEVAMILNKSGLSTIDLCYLVVDMAEIIKSELQENLKVIDIMRNRNGLLTTPGHVQDSIYYHICEKQGINLNTKSVKERPAIIREALRQWATDSAFRESNRIMRHWANLEYVSRSKGGKKTQPAAGNRVQKAMMKHFTPGMTAKTFRKALENNGFIVPQVDRTIQRWIERETTKNDNT